MLALRRDRSRRARLDAVLRRLHDRPHDSRAWFWQIQVKILRYVLSVYGDYEAPPPEQVEGSPATPAEGAGRGARSNAEIRRLVRDIAFLHRYPMLMNSELHRRFVDGTVDSPHVNGIDH